MRYMTLCLLGVLMVVPGQLAGQEQRTLIGGGVTSGGFGGPVVRFSSVAGKFAVFGGGRGGWIINHTFVIGLGGYGLANDIAVTPGAPSREIEFGYGGLELEYVNSWNRIVHVTGHVLIGGGGLTVKRLLVERSESLFVSEPAVNLEVNIVKFFRVNLGGGYRFVAGVEDPEVSASDLDGPFGQLTLKFGKF
ncbi:MAG: hypothetical protein OEW06_16480 [Gemmatimonadota bacterium]|nr:hypothetical protein [Gemmatimonadota bacterium]